MTNLIYARIVAALFVGVALATASAVAQTTWYVDDNAPNDPGSGDPTVSDPLEDGSAEHPFDAIQEGIDVATDADTVLVRDGTYTGTGNKHVGFGGKAITLRSENGPTTCIIDCEHTGDGRPGLSFGPEDLSTLVVGFTVMNAVDTGIGSYRGRPTIANCIIRDNWADNYGGGVFSNKGHLTLINCLIVGNSAGVAGGTDPGGGGIGLQSADILVVNCTIAGNHAESYGGGLRCRASSEPILVNCIVWGNTAGIGGQQVVLYATSPYVSLQYSNLQGGPDEVVIFGPGTVVWGPGCVDADPSFVDAINGDLRLGPESPCIDAGCNWRVPPDAADLDDDGNTDETTPLDLDGEGRFFDESGMPDTGCGNVPITDMGAYEFGDAGPAPCFGDFDDDNDVDLADLAALLANYGTYWTCEGDLDCDGDVDLNDLSALLAVYGTTCE